MSKFLLVGLAAAMLSACGGGSDGASSSSVGTADSQVFGASISGDGSSNFSVLGVATGCESVGSNGSCSVQITYTGVGASEGNVDLSPSTGYTTTIASCAPASAVESKCTFTITNNGVLGAQPLTIILGGRATSATFTFGQ